MFFDEKFLAKGAHRLAFHRNVPARFGIIPRFGTMTEIKWFEAKPCYILHLANCYGRGRRRGHGAAVSRPIRCRTLTPFPKEGYARMMAMLDMYPQETHMHRWRLEYEDWPDEGRISRRSGHGIPMTNADLGGPSVSLSYTPYRRKASGCSKA